MKVTRLHILEHPFLHNKPASDPPVHVIWEPHEFDYWGVDEKGDLLVGRREFANEHGEQYKYARQVPLMVIQHGMYAKAWEETEEYPDAVASVPVVELPIYTDPLHKEDGPELAPWNYDEHLESESEPVRLPYTDTDTGEHGELLFARAEVTHLEPKIDPDPEVEVEVVRVDESDGDDDKPEIYTDRTVINTEPIQYGDLGRVRIPSKLKIDPEYYKKLDLVIQEPEPELSDETELGIDDFSKQRPGYGWASGSYRSLADPTTEFKIPSGNTFFDEPGDLPSVPEVFGKDGKLGRIIPPRGLNETRIDLPTFLSPDPTDDAHQKKINEHILRAANNLRDKVDAEAEAGTEPKE